MGTGPGMSVFGENSFYRENRGTRRGGRHVVKRSSGPRVTHREVGSGTGPIASCGYFCPLWPAGVQYSEKFRFIEPQRVDGHRRPLLCAPSSGTSRESQAKIRDGTVWVL